MTAKNTILGFATVAVLSSGAFAAFVVSDNFDSYTNGGLVGQGGWTTTGTVVTNPLQVAGGADKDVTLATSGEDAYKALTSAVAHTDGSSVYTGLSLNVASAQATGDYLLHLSDPVATTGNFYQRFFAKSSGAGYVLGILGSSGGTPTYGATVLPYGTENKVVIAWNFVAGTLNDTFSVYVNPTSSTEGSNTPYLTSGWVATGAEPAATISAVNIRQGTAANSAVATIDDLGVATTFADLVVIPEPTTLGALAGLAVVSLRRRSVR